MSDEFPSGSYAGASLSRGEVDTVAGRFPVFPLVSGRGRKTDEVLTRSPRELRALWIVTRVELSIVVPGPDGERSG
jgi:hypothetical protein